MTRSEKPGLRELEEYDSLPAGTVRLNEKLKYAGSREEGCTEEQEEDLLWN